MEVFVFLKRCLLVFAFVGTLCVFSPGAAAQSNNSCLAITTWWFPLSIPTGWSYYGEYPGTYTYLIWAFNATCPPPPPCPCSSAPGGAPAYTAGTPISLATGNTYIEQKDVRIPGLAGGLNLVGDGTVRGLPVKALFKLAYLALLGAQHMRNKCSLGATIT